MQRKRGPGWSRFICHRPSHILELSHKLRVGLKLGTTITFFNCSGMIFVLASLALLRLVFQMCILLTSGEEC
jgi:hypothetical protein